LKENRNSFSYEWNI